MTTRQGKRVTMRLGEARNRDEDYNGRGIVGVSGPTVFFPLRKFVELMLQCLTDRLHCVLANSEMLWWRGVRDNVEYCLDHNVWVIPCFLRDLGECGTDRAGVDVVRCHDLRGFQKLRRKISWMNA